MKILKILRGRLSNLGAAVLFYAGWEKAQRLKVDHPRLAPGATLQDVSFFSPALNRQMTYRVFLPATLVPGQKLPVVYLLHGQGDEYRTWSNRCDIASYAAAAPRGGLILVMPEGASSY